MPQLTALNANITGNASGFVGASKLATFELNKLKSAASAAKREAEALAAANNTLEKRFERMKLATDTAYAGLVNFNKAQQLATEYAKKLDWTQSQLDEEIVRLANHFGVAEFQGRKFGDGVKSARFHSANLAAQFNDIGVMMASGQSPFILAMQQGTQISQVFNAMGGTVKEQMKVMAGSLLSVINPTSLLTIGVIAGTTALVQWAMAAGQSAEETEALKKKQEEAKVVTDALTDSVKKLRIEREFASSGHIFESAYNAEKEILALTAERDRLMSEINTKAESIGGKAAAYANQEAIAARDAAVARIGELNTLINKLNYEQKLATAARRRANELRDSLRAQFQEQQRINKAHADNVELMGRGKNETRLLTLAAQDALTKFSMMRTVAAGLANEIARAAAETRNIHLAGAVASRIGDDERGSQRGVRKDAATFNTGNTLERLGITSSGDWANTGGGGGGGQNPAELIQKELEQLQQSLMTQEQLEMESYARRQEMLKSALDQRLITQQQYSDMMAQVEATHNFAMLKQSNANVRGVLGNLQTVFQGSKKIGAAIALANSYLAFTEVLKDPAYVGRPFARFAAAAAALASGLQAVRSIKSASPGGSGGSISTGGAGATGGGEGQATRQQSVVLQLSGGDMFSRPQIISLINAINEASEDGARIRVA